MDDLYAAVRAHEADLHEAAAARQLTRAARPPRSAGFYERLWWFWRPRRTGLHYLRWRDDGDLLLLAGRR